MAMTSHVSNAEISSNPNTGLVVGDANPATTQLGVMTKLRDADDENNTDLGAHKTTFDAHDHGAAGGGQPIGTGPVVAIAANGIDNAALGTGSITSAKVQAGAIETAKIADESVEKAQIGVPKSVSKTATGSGTKTFSFSGASAVPLFSIEAAHNGDKHQHTVHSVSSSGCSVDYDFTGFAGIGGSGDPSITCRAYGVTNVT